MYRHYYTLLQLFSCVCISKHGHTWAASVLLVLMRISPLNLHVYSRLITSPSSVDGTVYRCPHTLPHSHYLAWLSQIQVLFLKFWVHTCAYIMLQALSQSWQGSNDKIRELDLIILILLKQVGRTRSPQTFILGTLVPLWSIPSKYFA